MSLLVIASFIATLTHAARSATERDAKARVGHVRSPVTWSRSVTPCASCATEGGDADAPVEHAIVRSTAAHVTRPACADARRGLAYYRSAAERWRLKLGAGSGTGISTGSHRSCPHLHRAVRYWRAKAHAWRLRYEAQRDRFRALYEKWRCIHEHEGAWNANNPPYHGGLQFDDGFQHTYGPEFMRRWGGAENWPVYAQLIAAERAYRGYAGYAGRGFGPWPNTRRMCGV